MRTVNCQNSSETFWKNHLVWYFTTDNKALKFALSSYIFHNFINLGTIENQAFFVHIYANFYSQTQ